MYRKRIVPVVLLAISLLMAACLSLPFGTQTPIPVQTAVQTQAAGDIPATQIVQTVAAAQTEGAYNTVVAELTQISQVTSTPPAPTDTPVPPTEAVIPTETEPPADTATLAPEVENPTAAPLLATSTPASSYCDWAMYVDDMSVADGTTFLPGQPFTKTWRIKNIGTCTWTTDYALALVGGTNMGGIDEVNLSSAVLPGHMVDISVNLVAPGIPGPYTGFWMMRNADNATFGIDKYANSAIWVKINVAGSVAATQNPQVPLSLTGTYCGAEWQSSVAYLTCPSPVNDFVNGSVILSMSSKLADGTINSSPVLVVIPNDGSGGMISGTYPGYNVKPGDRFSTAIGCLADNPNCNITFQLNYTVNGGNMQSLGSWIETSNGTITPINIDLSPYISQTMTFILEVKNNNGSSTDDRGFWLLPQISHP